MNKEDKPINFLCVRQPSEDIHRALQNVEIALLTKLVDLPNTPKSGRRRIQVEFEYERTSENPWGDFVKWNIIETEITTETKQTVKKLFEE